MATRVVGKFLMYFGDVLVVASLVTLLIDFLGVVDLAQAWAVTVFTAFGAGLGIALLGTQLREPRTRRIRSSHSANVRSESGSGVLVGIGYVAGLCRIKKMHGRRKPRYRFKVNEVPVILRHNSVALGSDDEWKLRVSRRRATVRSREGSHLAEAIRMRPAAKRWVISDDVMEFEATIANTRQENTGAQARDLALFRSDDAPKPVASVHLSYEMASRDNWSTGDRYYEGVFDGTMEASAPVPVAVAVLALRLALGRWVLQGPRTGRWEYEPRGV